MTFPKHVHMVGIGGIGMSALAQLLVSEGVTVTGSDRDESPTTELLRGKGVSVAIGHTAVPDAAELLIYSDAVPQEDPERAAARERGTQEQSYFQALGEYSRSKRTIAVSGTHGKTTTTGMLTKILTDAGAKPTAVIGSIVRDFGSNFVPGDSDIFIVEGCEYRDHLLELSPEILIITNIELDHTDYFPDLARLQDTFAKAVERVPERGAVIANPNDPRVAPVVARARCRVIDYTQKAVGSLQLLGEFNRENARAALAGAEAVIPKLSLEAAIASLSSFKGSWRRFEYKGKTQAGAEVYDDYAHHPTAVKKTISAARERFPDKKIVVAFHPHLYSRTKSFMDEFGDALRLADSAIIAPIYAAREAPDPSVSHHVLAEKVGEDARAMDSFEEIEDALSREDDKALIITMGAGDIYKVAEKIVRL